MTSEKITSIYSDPSWSVLRQGWNNFHACGLHHSAYGPTIYLYDEFAMLTPRRSHQLCLSVSHRHACVPGHFSHVWLWTWTVAHQVPLSMGFSRQESWSGLPCPPPGNLPHPGIEPTSLGSPALAGRFFTTSTTWEAPSRVGPEVCTSESFFSAVTLPIVQLLGFPQPLQCDGRGRPSRSCRNVGKGLPRAGWWGKSSGSGFAVALDPSWLLWNMI